MQLLQVAVSGTVGKQVFAANKQVIVKGMYLTPSGANATIKVRDGAAPTSAEIVFFGRAPSAAGTKDFVIGGNGMKFNKGLHVTVIGTNAQAYLLID